MEIYHSSCTNKTIPAQEAHLHLPFRTKLNNHHLDHRFLHKYHRSNSNNKLSLVEQLEYKPKGWLHILLKSMKTMEF